MALLVILNALLSINTLLIVAALLASDKYRYSQMMHPYTASIPA